MLSSDRHLLLRRVPPAAASCLEIGSTSPGALLYDARRLFDAQDARATGGWVQEHCSVGINRGRGQRVMRRRPLSMQFHGVWTSAKGSTCHRSPIRRKLTCLRTARRVSCALCAISHAGELLDLVRSGELSGAVDDCLAAAAAELDPLKQAALLKASCYGRAFRQLEPPAASQQQQQQQQQVDAVSSGSGVSGDPRRQAVEVARRLRVLNALRDPGALLDWHAWSGWSRWAGV